MALSFIDRIKATLSGTPATIPSVPVAISTVVQADNSAEVKFGFTSQGQAQYKLEETYHAHMLEQAKIAGISLQTNYTAQFIVNGTTFVVDPSKTFAELNAQYSVSPQTPVSVVIPDPEKPAGELG